MEAYILITTSVGRAGSLAREVAAIEGIGSADTVTGAYDVVARARVDSLTELHDRILTRIADAGGATRILPCVVPHAGGIADPAWDEERAAAS